MIELSERQKSYHRELSHWDTASVLAGWINELEKAKEEREQAQEKEAVARIEGF